MVNIKTLLRKWPSLYSVLQKAYYSTRKAMETYLLGTKMQEWIWQSRRIEMYKDWVTRNDESINHPHRQLLLQKILSYAPLDSVLEIGCNTGPNLYLLNLKLPQAILYGIDINPRAISIARAWLDQQEVKNVVLAVGKADNLERFHDKSMDIVFTDATLMYIGPDKIRKVLKQMQRISRKALVFNEWHQESVAKEHIYYDGHWVYNYRKLISDCFVHKDIKISKIPKEVWSGSGWEEFGAIVEVSL